MPDCSTTSSVVLLQMGTTLNSAREMTCSPPQSCVIIHLHYYSIPIIYKYLPFTTSLPLHQQTHKPQLPSTRYFLQVFSEPQTLHFRGTPNNMTIANANRAPSTPSAA